MTSPRSPRRRRNLCPLHRRSPRALAFAALLGAAATPAALHAADYLYKNSTGNFSDGFNPALTGVTTADDLVFGAGAYTATDDVSNLTVNGLRFNNSGTATVARGSGDNTVNLGGTNPFIDFNNSGLITLAADSVFQTSGFIVKSNGGAGTTNPVISGGIGLGAAGNNVQVVLADTPGDATAELSITGVVSGSGSLSLQNNAVVPTAAAGAAGGIAPLANQQDYGTLLLTGANTYTGGTFINAGRLVITNANSLGTGTVTIAGINTASGGTISSTGGTLAFGNGNYTTNGASGVIAGTGITIANNVNLAGATSGNYGHGIENNVGNNTIAGTVTLNGTAIVQVNGTTTLSLGAGANGVGESASGSTMTKQGTGTLFINNATYTGGTNILAGAVQFNGTAPTAGTITIGNATNTTGALNVGPGTAFPTLGSLINGGLLASSSVGTLALTGDVSDSFDFGTYANLSIGSAVSGNGVNYTGVPTGGIVNLGGGTANGVLRLPNANQLTPGQFLRIGPVGTNGTVILANTNSHDQGTSIGGGTLQFVQGALGTGPLYFGDVLGAAGSGGGTLQFAPGNTQDVSLGAGIIKTGDTLIDTNGNNVTFANSFHNNGTNGVAPGSITKLGAGTLTLNGNNNTNQNADGSAGAAYAGGTFFVRQGTLAVSGPAATLQATNYSSVGAGQGDNGTLTVSGGAKVTTSGDFNVSDVNGSNGVLLISDATGAGTRVAVNTLYVGKGGNNAGGTALTTQGSVNQTGGTLNNNAGGGDWRIGGGLATTDGSQNAIGSYDISGGTLSDSGNLQIGAYGTGQLTVSGTGAVTVGAVVSVARFANSYGVLNIQGGSVTPTNAASNLLVGEVGTGIANVGYGAAGSTGTFNASNVAALRIGGITNTAIPGKGVVNLGPGGVIQAKTVGTASATATSVLNFHGGTLQAVNSSNTFLQGLTNAYIYSEGAVINVPSTSPTTPVSVTIAQPLRAPTGGGVQTISVANGGSGYAANPVIKITSSTGAGFGASAIPVLTNGVLTAITITNPGTGYTAPVVTISGGNPATAATLGAVSVNATAPASGALTKIGTGTLTLTGTNTYAGGTLINAGILAAGANSALGTGNVTIAAGATLTLNMNVTNAIADNALVTINGPAGASGIFDLEGNANAIQETVGTLVLNGVYQPIGTYGAPGSGATFTNSYFAGQGILNVTAIPEPGTWALLGLGVAALGVTGCARRRQSRV